MGDNQRYGKKNVNIEGEMNRKEAIKYLVNNEGAVLRDMSGIYYWQDDNGRIVFSRYKNDILKESWKPDHSGVGRSYMDAGQYEIYTPPKPVKKVQLWETVTDWGATELCDNKGRYPLFGLQEFLDEDHFEDHHVHLNIDFEGYLELALKNRTSRTFTLHCDDENGWRITEGWEE